MKHECKHCNKTAKWRWDDADGNEHSYICQSCMETVGFYADKPLWQFTGLTVQQEIERTSRIHTGRTKVSA